MDDFSSLVDIASKLKRGGHKFMELVDKIRSIAAPSGDYPGMLGKLNYSLLSVTAEILFDFADIILNNMNISESYFCVSIDALCTSSLAYSCMYIQDKKNESFNMCFKVLEKGIDASLKRMLNIIFVKNCCASGFNLGAYLFKEKRYSQSLKILFMVIDISEKYEFIQLKKKSYHLKALCFLALGYKKSDEFYYAISNSDNPVSILYSWISISPPKNPELICNFLKSENDISILFPYFALHGNFNYLLKGSEFEFVFPDLVLPKKVFFNDKNLELELRRVNELFGFGMYFDCFNEAVILLKKIPKTKVKPMTMLSLFFIYYWITQSNLYIGRIEIASWYSIEMQKLFSDYPFVKGFAKFLEVKCKIKKSSIEDINKIPKLKHQGKINWDGIISLVNAISLAFDYDERCFYYFQNVFNDTNIFIKREAFHYYVTTCRIFSISPDIDSFSSICETSSESKALFLFHMCINLLSFENIDDFWKYENPVNPPKQVTDMIDMAISIVPSNITLLRRLFLLKAICIGTNDQLTTANLITSSISQSVDIYLEKTLNLHFKIPFPILAISYFNVPGLEKCLLFAFYHPFSRPFVVRILTLNDFDDILNELDEIQEESVNISPTLSNEEWWLKKYKLDKRFEMILNKLENLLGIWIGLFSPLIFKPTQNAQKSAILAALKKYPHLQSNFQINRNLLKITNISEKLSLSLILGKSTHRIPWESFKIVSEYQIEITRIPSIKLIVSQTQKNIPVHIDPRSTFFILNPKGDLEDTENTFTPLFKDFNWDGITRGLPNSEIIEDSIKNKELFIYCGHGSGNEYFDYQSLVLENNHCKATMLLMGCSSGKLIDEGEIDPYGVPFYCVIAGSGSVLANLWDVTDRDIDRFLKQILEFIHENDKLNLEEAEMLARNACKLRYLTGAAPVLYGFPTLIQRDNCIDNIY